MKILNIAAYSILILCIGFTLLTTYWQFYPYNVLTYQQGDFPLLKKQYAPGEALSYKVDVTQNTNNIKVDVIKSLQNDIIINFSPSSYVTMKGRQQFTNSSLAIPTTAPPGKYRLVTVSQYHINPIRVITITRQSEEFEIVGQIGQGISTKP